MPVINYYTISLFIGSITAVSSGIFVYIKNRRGLVNKTFLWVTISSAIWSAGYLGMILSTKKPVSWYYNWTLHAAAILIPAFYTHFALALIDEADKRKKILFFAYFISIILLLLNPTRLFIQDMKPKFIFNFCCDAGPLYILFALQFFGWVVYSFYKIFMTARTKTGIQSLQLKYALLASAAGFLGGGSVFLLTFNVQFPPYPLFLFALYPALTAYAIVRYRLMNINIVLTRAGIFIVVYALVLGIPFWLGYATKFWLPSTALAVFLATLGPFVFTYFRRKAERRLRKEEFLAHQALNRLAQNMMRVTKLDTLLKLIVHYVVKIMKVNFASIYLRDEANKHYHLRATRSINKTPAEQSEFEEDSSLVKDILLRRVPIVVEELSFGRTSKISPHLKKLQLELHRSKAAVVIPAFKGEYLFGFLLLGARENNRLFTQEDLNLLLLLANQSVLAIENAQLFEKEKVLLAEKSRRDALADMAPGVAHQFNNRLISISMVADTQFALNEEEDLDKLSPDKFKSLLEQSQKAFESISKDAIRGKDIADAILKKGKAKLTYERKDLAPIIQTAIELLKVSRTRKSLEGAEEPEVILDAEENLPKLILTESLIQDVFYNFIDNARDAVIIKNKAINENRITPDETPYKGKITITVRKKDNKVIVTVNDNGIGMDEKTKSRLFVPYFTTKATSLKGTGMGLWVIRSFIEDHKGKISFESEYGKGTTFTITFPIKEAKS